MIIFVLKMEKQYFYSFCSYSNNMDLGLNLGDAEVSFTSY